MDVYYHHLGNPNRSAIDVHTGQDLIYVLTKTREIDLYERNGTSLIYLRSISLAKKHRKPLSLYVDEDTVIVGYDDGTVELRLINEDYGILRITSTDDPSGPGSARVTGILASDSYLLVKAHENGLLIYSKPSLLFYKWIMIGGHTKIKSASIRHEILYVLTAENEIHLLNFQHHRIYEQEVMSYQYVDIEYDSTYLYAATSTSVLIYKSREDTPTKPDFIDQLNFDQTIYGLIIVGRNLFILFDNRLLPVVIDYQNNKESQFLETIEIPDRQLYTKLKYNYFSTQPTRSRMKKIEIAWLIDGNIEVMEVEFP